MSKPDDDPFDRAKCYLCTDQDGNGTLHSTPLAAILERLACGSEIDGQFPDTLAVCGYSDEPRAITRFTELSWRTYSAEEVLGLLAARFQVSAPKGN